MAHDDPKQRTAQKKVLANLKLATSALENAIGDWQTIQKNEKQIKKTQKAAAPKAAKSTTAVSLLKRIKKQLDALES
jgi:hypothetical protein